MSLHRHTHPQPQLDVDIAVTGMKKLNKLHKVKVLVL